MDQGGFILSSGYNGSPSGMAHCRDVGCYIESGHCIRSIHAEMNAIITAARKGISLSDSTIYTTTRPCLRCLTALAQAGVKHIMYEYEYDTDNFYDAQDWAKKMGLTLSRF